MSADYSMEWRKRDAFAEYAEAVGVPTDQVALAGSLAPGIELVIFSPDRDLDKTVAIASTFRRDADGLLVKIDEREIPDFFDELEEELKRRLNA